MVRKLIFALAAGAIALTAAACNTVKGVGRDIESVGKAGSDTMHKKR
ncbi:MAG: entericidin A/B family lipoprotein [Novosphingobium sp.]|jgi:predicted small secreted protein|nr:entericidin A/B family lipoprotein [Novosphingobium sp.]